MQYVPHQQWPEYDLLSETPIFFKPKYIGVSPRGIRLKIGPIWVDSFISDLEPVIEPLNKSFFPKLHIVMWQRCESKEKPPGWKSFFQSTGPLIGYVDLHAASWETYSPNLRRALRAWRQFLSEKIYRVETIDASEFVAAYSKSTIPAFIKREFIETFNTAASKRSCTVSYIGVRDLRSNSIYAGMAITDSPTHAASYNISSFYRAEASRHPVTAGLFDAWFTHCLRTGIRFAHLGNLWAPGKPSGWRGFSDFKKKFHPQLVQFPTRLYKFSISS